MKTVFENAPSGQTLKPLHFTAPIKAVPVAALVVGGAVVIVGSLGPIHDVRPGCEPTLVQACAPDPVIMPDEPTHPRRAPPLQEHLVVRAVTTATAALWVGAPVGRR